MAQKLRHLDWLKLFFIVLAAYTIVRFGLLSVQPPGFIPNDYSINHRTSERLVLDEPIYQPQDPSPFKYSPTFLAAFYLTFHQLPKNTAWLLWCSLSIIAFCFAAHWFLKFGLGTRKLSELELSQKALALVIAAFTVFSWHGYLEHFSYGQVDYILFALFIAAVRFAESRKQWWLSALCMSFSLLIKPQTAVLLSYFLVIRNWTILLSTISFTIGLLFLPALGWGLTRQLEFFSQWRAGLSQQSTEFLTGNLNQSLASVVARLSGARESMLKLAFSVIGAAGLSALGLTAITPKTSRKNPLYRARVAAFSLALYLVATPLSWRWITFIWMPIGVLLASDAIIGLKRVMRSENSADLDLSNFPWLLHGQILVLFLFAINGTLLQAVVAHFLGIGEVDELSYAGLYCFGNVLLLIAAALSLAQNLRDTATTRQS